MLWEMSGDDDIAFCMVGPVKSTEAGNVVCGWVREV